MPTSIALRPVTPADVGLMFEVYAGSRAPELDIVPWSDDQKEAFLHSQFKAQQAHYEEVFSEAEHSVVVADGEPVGRLWVDENATEIRILDLAILPERRGNGVGTLVLKYLIGRARESGKPIRVSVENYQKSFALLNQLGFDEIRNDGVNRLMEWRPVVSPASVSKRKVKPEDRDFLFELYRRLRESELKSVGWDDEQISVFARNQFDAQTAGYRAQFPDSDHELIIHDSTPMGRLWVNRTDSLITLIDITLLPEYRSRGIGTSLLRQLLAEAKVSQRSVSLSVVTGNPARRLYSRLGFQSEDSDGVYERMSWRPDS